MKIYLATSNNHDGPGTTRLDKAVAMNQVYEGGEGIGPKGFEERKGLGK